MKSGLPRPHPTVDLGDMAASTSESPSSASLVPKTQMRPLTSALIGQEVKVGAVALISLNNSLGPVALPLFFPETSLHSGPHNTDTYCELFRVNE